MFHLFARLPMPCWFYESISSWSRMPDRFLLQSCRLAIQIYERAYRAVDVLTLCPSGTYGVLSAGVSAAQACASCVAGYFCPNPGTVSSTMVLCPAGSYCPSGSSSPVNCPAGTFSQKVGQSSVTTCVLCPSGEYCLNSGTSEYQNCPLNYFCPIGTSDYSSFPCPAGTYGLSTGYYTASQCQNCTIGSYCLSGSSPSACPVGTFNPFEGGTSGTSCLPCELGFACPQTGMFAMTTPCAAGHYCPLGTQYSTQYACPSGTFSDATDLVMYSQY